MLSEVAVCVGVRLLTLPPAFHQFAKLFSSEVIELQTELVRLHSIKSRLAKRSLHPQFGLRQIYNWRIRQSQGETAAAEFASLVQKTNSPLNAFTKSSRDTFLNRLIWR
jgi:hypothetical protein